MKHNPFGNQPRQRPMGQTATPQAPYSAGAANQVALQKLANLQVQIAQMSAANQVKKAQLDIKNAAMRQGTVPVNGPQDVQTNLRNILPDYLMPGNLGDVNKVCWPFWFTNITPNLPAAIDDTQSQASATVTITQEAAFIICSFTKGVFVRDPDTGFCTYVDPAAPGAAGLTPGLSMTLTDAQSSRVFMSKPMDFDTIGYSQFPTELPTPLMFLPNSIIQTQLFNSNPDLEYIPFVTFFGVRCRIEDAQRIMSLVTG